MPETQAEVQKVVFRSTDPTLRLVRKPEKRRYNEQGDLEILEGVRFEFQDGVLEVPEGDDAEWLRKHPRFNVKFIELGNEPGREHPTVDEAMLEIAEAAAAGDADALSEIYDREKQTYDRGNVLQVVEAALARLESADGLVDEADLPPEPVEEGG